MRSAAYDPKTHHGLITTHPMSMQIESVKVFVDSTIIDGNIYVKARTGLAQHIGFTGVLLAQPRQVTRKDGSERTEIYAISPGNQMTRVGTVKRFTYCPRTGRVINCSWIKLSRLRRNRQVTNSPLGSRVISWIQEQRKYIIHGLEQTAHQVLQRYPAARQDQQLIQFMQWLRDNTDPHQARYEPAVEERGKAEPAVEQPIRPDYLDNTKRGLSALHRERHQARIAEEQELAREADQRSPLWVKAAQDVRHASEQRQLIEQLQQQLERLSERIQQLEQEHQQLVVVRGFLQELWRIADQEQAISLIGAMFDNPDVQALLR